MGTSHRGERCRSRLWERHWAGIGQRSKPGQALRTTRRPILYGRRLCHEALQNSTIIVFEHSSSPLSRAAGRVHHCLHCFARCRARLSRRHQTPACSSSREIKRGYQQSRPGADSPADRSCIRSPPVNPSTAAPHQQHHQHHQHHQQPQQRPPPPPTAR